MLWTPTTRAWEIGVDVFPVAGRPCRESQEKIVDYLNDGRPLFEWERLKQAYAFHNVPRVLEYCDNCFLSIFGGLEGCVGQVGHLDEFFAAIAELAPDSPWNDVNQDGTPVFPDVVRALTEDLERLRIRLHQTEWPIAQPRFQGVAIREQLAEGPGRRQFYAWNGDGPPSIITHNDGYQLFFSKHGLLVKATHDDPMPHTFLKIWREASGMHGLNSMGQTIRFPIQRGQMPSWGDETPVVGSELVSEAIPTDEVFADVFDILDVFCGVANQFDTGLTLRPLGVT